MESNRGLVDIASRHSVAETVARLESTLRAHGITLFALIDHSGEAAKVGMEMPPTKLLIFGKPEAGTPLMRAAPACAIDLPLKILVREDGERVWITYNDAAYLAARHGLAPELRSVLAAVEGLAAKAAE